MPPRSLVFVYGTLMRGECHHDSMERAVFLREAQTLPHYELVLIDYYPALVSDGSQAVRGELYEVDDATLRDLDELEEVPTLYQRKRIALSCGTHAETYLLPRALADGAPVIASGLFRGGAGSVSKTR